VIAIHLCPDGRPADTITATSVVLVVSREVDSNCLPDKSDWKGVDNGKEWEEATLR
jgi:hypothetical protein